MKYSKEEIKNAQRAKWYLIKNGKLFSSRCDLKTKQIKYKCVDCLKELHNHICYAYNHKFRCGNCLEQYKQKEKINNKNNIKKDIKNNINKMYWRISYLKRKYNFQYEIKKGIISYLCLNCGSLVSKVPLQVAYSNNFRCNECICKNTKKQIKENNNNFKEEIKKSIEKQYIPYNISSIIITKKENSEVPNEIKSCGSSCNCNSKNNEKRECENFKKNNIFTKIKNYFLKEKYSKISINSKDIKKMQYLDGKLIIIFNKNKYELKNIEK